MKKILAMMLTVLLGATAMSGCGQKTVPSANDETVPAVQSDVDKTQFIDEQKAQEIALTRAEIETANDVIFERIELERDDGIWVYEVEFIKDGMEYSTEIKADDGTVISWEVEKKD
ncbi:MAG: PepSY domain-containing protein [Clostridia bacterium]|nr:PepSY domain-containing protein [Clostridia bacterium]